MTIVKKNPALAIGVLYILGVLVTAIHLSRFAIYDLDLTKIRYVFAGGMCAFFLLLRIALAIFVVEHRFIRSTLKSAEEAVHQSLQGKWVFRILNRIASSRLAGFFFKGYTSRGLAQKLVQGVGVVGALFLFGAYFILLKTDGTGLRLNFDTLVAGLPFAIATLFMLQVVYIVSFYFRLTFQTAEPLHYLWQMVLALLVIIDIGLYSLVIHPLVKPAFGGGVVVQASLFASDADTSKLLDDATNIKFTSSTSSKVFIIHSSSEAYYVTSKYELNYSSRDLENMIEHDKVYRIQKRLLAGYETTVFK